MTKRTETQWRTLFAKFDKSRQTAATFCRENKLCSKYFSLRRKQLGVEKSKAKRKPRFSKVNISETLKPSASHPEYRLILPNGVILVMTDFQEHQLGALLRSAMLLN